MGYDVDINLADSGDDEDVYTTDGSGSGDTGDYNHNTATLGPATLGTPDEQTSGELSDLTLALIVSISAAILVSLLIVLVFYCRRRRKKQKQRKTMNVSMMSNRNNDVISPLSTSGCVVQTDSKGRRLQYHQLDPRELIASNKIENNFNVPETSEVHIYERVV